MTKLTIMGAGAGVLLLGLTLGAQTSSSQPQAKPAAPTPAKPAMAVAHKSASPTAEPQPDLVKQYCVGCHSDKGKAGQLTLASYDSTHPEQNAETTEKIIHKLRAGMMPPPGVRRPDAEVL